MQIRATVFEFTSYIFEPDKKRVVFNYKTEFNNGKEPLVFTETVILPKIPDMAHIPQGLMDTLLQSLHIILGISYYKFYCPPAVAFGAKEGATLSKSQADFWNTIYKKGLGEFFYKNNLNPNTSPKFPHSTDVKLPVTHYALPVTDRVLVGIGGGKDSIVAAELLKEGGFDMTAFHVETNKKSPLVEDVINILGAQELKIQRYLDWQAHQVHQYNGHIPISAIYAFLGLLSAVLYQYSHIIVGNEHSSNFGNIIYKGLEINHQWSKSHEFEKLFQNYVKNFITKDVLYFSLLRSFYEIRIVKLFSKYKQYFSSFSSCNANFKIISDSLIRTNERMKGLWCGHCAKCVFAFTLLSAYLSKKELIGIFGRNLYQDERLLPIWEDILGFGSMKPFDCVGTFQEAQTALFLAKKKFASDFIVAQLSGPTPPSGVRHARNHVKYYPEVFQTNRENSVPEEFKFLGMEKVLIAGFGKEGEVTKKYFKKEFPKIKMAVADARQGTGYLKKQADFDIAIKTPGINKELIKIPYTTATNIFFSKIKGKYPIVSITGSKGKSTTSTLTYEIIENSGRPVEFLGNIGKPMLGALMTPIKPGTIFVLELSSYQLDDIAFSPDISVVTNLFPEHLNYHGNVKNYYQAKKNIINFQNAGEYFIYNPANKEIATWLKNYRGQTVKFASDTFETNLIGQHNQSNIQAAAAVARTLNIPEKIIKDTIKNFKGLPHRLELVGEFEGIKFYDDAISTTPESTIMAIKALHNIGTIFLGGQDRGYNFIQLEKTIKQYKIENIVLFPDSGEKIIKNKTGLNILKTDSMKKAVQFAYKNTKPGEICLLSCASPSYSLWKNFEEKGDQFKKFVKHAQAH